MIWVINELKGYVTISNNGKQPFKKDVPYYRFIRFPYSYWMINPKTNKKEGIYTPIEIISIEGTFVLDDNTEKRDNLINHGESILNKLIEQ